MSRKGRDLEILISLLEDIFSSDDVKIQSPETIVGESGTSRFVDVTLRGKVGSADYLMIVECRDRNDKEDIMWIDEIVGKRKDVKADKAMAVSSIGFSKGAIESAKINNIELRSLKEISPDDFPFDKVVIIPTEIKHLTKEVTFCGKSKVDYQENWNAPLNSIRFIDKVSKKVFTIDQIIIYFVLGDFVKKHPELNENKINVTYKVMCPNLQILIDEGSFPNAISENGFEIEYLMMNLDIWAESSEAVDKKYKTYEKVDDNVLIKVVEAENDLFKGSVFGVGVSPMDNKLIAYVRDKEK